LIFAFATLTWIKVALARSRAITSLANAAALYKRGNRRADLPRAGCGPTTTTSEVNDMAEDGASRPHPETAAVIEQFNDAFVQRDPAKLVNLVAEDCVMESVQPPPNGTRYEGYDTCLRFWQELIADPNGSFQPEVSSYQATGQRCAGATTSVRAKRTRCAASTSYTSATGRSWKRSDVRECPPSARLAAQRYRSCAMALPREISASSSSATC
jgi:ketosteroid isomerase-like protein